MPAKPTPWYAPSARSSPGCCRVARKCFAHWDAGELDVQGNRELFQRFVETLDEFEPMFNVVEP